MNCRQKQNNVARSYRWGLSLLTLTASAHLTHGQEFRYVEKIVVAEPTTLDWVFPLSGTSPPTIPPGLATATERGGKFSYEFYGPAEDAGAGLPLVVFVSPENRPVGWHFWAATCQRHGVMFAGVRDAGNGVPEVRRVRAVVETLGDVRRRQRVDPERTYLAGFSGGAHVACRTAFALPEYVGGVAAIGYAPRPPEDPWLRLRMRDRLSLAIIVGEREPASAWAADLEAPRFAELGVRTDVNELRRWGHRMPGAAVMEEAFRWLEKDVERRRALAARFPAASDGVGRSRDEWAAAALEEADQRLATLDSLDSGLVALEAISRRWSNLPPGVEARQRLSEYQTRSPQPWLAERKNATRRLARIEAAGYERLALRSDVSLRAQRGTLLQLAIQSWEAAQEGTEADVELKKRVARLREKLAETPVKERTIPISQVRFRLVGEVTLAEGIERLRNAFASLGYELRVASAAEAIIDGAGERRIKLDLPAATFSEVDRRFLRRHGLKGVRKGSVIQLELLVK